MTSHDDSTWLVLLCLRESLSTKNLKWFSRETVWNKWHPNSKSDTLPWKLFLGSTIRVSLSNLKSEIIIFTWHPTEPQLEKWPPWKLFLGDLLGKGVNLEPETWKESLRRELGHHERSNSTVEQKNHPKLQWERFFEKIDRKGFTYKKMLPLSVENFLGATLSKTGG